MRVNTYARANRYLTDKRDKKNHAHRAADCSQYFLFARPLSIGIRIRSITDRYLSVQRNILRRRLSYESALNASSNEINMSDGSSRVIYGHKHDTKDLREFVTNFSDSNHNRNNRLSLKRSRKPIMHVKLM